MKSFLASIPHWIAGTVRNTRIIPLSVTAIIVVAAGFTFYRSKTMRSPVFTGSLPKVTPGPHKAIGYAYIRCPAAHTYAIPSPKYRSSGKSVLNVQEIGFAIFHPCSPAGKEGKTWVPDPANDVVLGYEKFIGRKGVSWILKGLKYVVGRLRFPVYPTAPLKLKDTPYPLVIFSHGLGGTRHTYTQYVSALASRGYVVLVPEHRDGSGPAVQGINGDVLHYIRKDELQWSDEQDISLQYFRTLQLDVRVREVYEVYDAFKRLAEGNIAGMQIEKQGSVSSEWADAFKKVDHSQVNLTGHSFGGGTLLHLLQNQPPKPYSPLPVNRVVALDPWIDPLPLPSASTQPLEKPPPMLVINSPGFTVWRGHFDRLLRIVRKANGDLMTIMGGNHQSFSDFPLLAPTSPAKALLLLSRIHELSYLFLQDRLSQSELDEGKADGGDFARDEKGKMSSTQNAVVHLRRENR